MINMDIQQIKESYYEYNTPTLQSASDFGTYCYGEFPINLIRW